MRPENIACGRSVIEVSDNPLNILLDIWPDELVSIAV
jgi:hypothetical protein